MSFNPRARVGRDLCAGKGGPSPYRGFNPRARVGRDPYEMMYADQCRWCFNPRARVGRDLAVLDEIVGTHTVSIHAPAWGATCAEFYCKRILKDVSIHAPAWGATMLIQVTRSCGHVSIHAPAWGATPTCVGRRKRPSFQSTRPRGARPL